MRDEPHSKSQEWDTIVALTVHPIKVAAVEAMRWIEEPFSAIDLTRMYDKPPSLPTAAYHLRALAFDLPILRLYKEEMLRGAKRKIYFFRNRTPASRRRKRAA
jgi:hypothetical protein